MRAAEWEFRLLGPLDVWYRGEPVPIPSAKQRVLLAALLVEANRPVTVARLIALLWGDRHPHSARSTLQIHVSRLRRTLGSGGGSVSLATSAAGYRLVTDDDAVDLRRFTTLVDRARSDLAAGALDRATLLLREALELWRGEPLADVPSDVLHHEVVPSLVEQRLTALELRVDVDLRLRRHHDLVTELMGLTTRYPLRERLWALLMLALYRCGRPAEALATYQKACALLADELSVDPGPELQALHQHVLTNDPVLALDPPAPQRDERPVVPRQLPAAPRSFTGRAGELAALTRALEDTGGTPAISVIHGIGGIGKTWLALEWARRHLDRWPDGQLFVDLRGFSPAGEPTTEANALRGFLEALGVAPAAIPVELDAQVGLYRSLVADRYLLILLDNARDTAQITSLLPGSPTCTVLVTSRNRLDGLVVTHGGQSVSLDVLTDQESRVLMTSRLGPERLAAEPGATARLLDCCAGFPLALSIMAGHADTHPDFPLALLASELSDATTRLSVLDGEDSRSSLPAVLSWSYRTLTEEQAQVFRLLGMASGPDFSLPAVAALAGTSVARAQAVLRILERVSLVRQHVPGRYRMHDLVRLYAAELARGHDTEAARRTALHRMLDHHLHSAHAAARLFHPQRHHIMVSAPLTGVSTVELTDGGQATDWLIAERPVLIEAVRLAAEAGFDAHAWQLTWALANFLDRYGHWHDHLEIQHLALLASQRLGDRNGLAQSHSGLARAYMQFGRYDDAFIHLERALEAFRQLDDRLGQVRAHQNLAWLLRLWHRYREALDHSQHALDASRITGDRVALASSLDSVGYSHAHLGNYDDAIAYCQEALELQQEMGNDRGLAGTWDSLGYAHHQLGHHLQAIVCYQNALELNRKLMDRYEQALTLSRLGDTYHAAGDNQPARQAWRESLCILEEFDIPSDNHLRATVRASLEECVADDSRPHEIGATRLT